MSDIDDKLKSEALNWLVSLRGTAEKASSFALDQAPDLLREILALGRIQATTYVLIGLIAVAVGLWWIIGLTKIDWDGDELQYKDVTRMIRAGLGIFAVIIGPLIFLGNLSVLLQVWFAPRLYLVEQISDLIRGMGGR